MTLRSEDFEIRWPTAEGMDKPASYTEIVSAMAEINDLVSKSRPGSVVSLTLRTPVAVEICSRVNQAGTGYIIVDREKEPQFVPERGGYQSIVHVAQSRDIMDHFVKRM